MFSNAPKKQSRGLIRGGGLQIHTDSMQLIKKSGIKGGSRSLDPRTKADSPGKNATLGDFCGDYKIGIGPGPFQRIASGVLASAGWPARPKDRGPRRPNSMPVSFLSFGRRSAINSFMAPFSSFPGNNLPEAAN